MKQILFLTFFCILVIACKKTTTYSSTLSSVTVVNAMVNSSSVLPNFGGTGFYAQDQSVYFGGFYEYALASGNNQLSVVQGTDSTQTAFSGQLSLMANGIYSLFLTGAGVTADTVFVHDQIPHYTDSVVGLRFINCSPGSNPFSVNIQGASTPLVNSLAYKQISTFQSMLGSGYNPSYTIEVRDAVSDSLLATYAGAGQIFSSQTIVIAGIDTANAPLPITVFAVNNY